MNAKDFNYRIHVYLEANVWIWELRDAGRLVGFGRAPDEGSAYFRAGAKLHEVRHGGS